MRLAYSPVPTSTDFPGTETGATPGERAERGPGEMTGERHIVRRVLEHCFTAVWVQPT